MHCNKLERVNLNSILPKEIKDSLVCFTFVNSKVIEDAPDIATCNTNGYMYELKNNKILRSLNLEDHPSTVSCYYINEQNKLVIFYLVFTINKRLLIIRSTNKRLKVEKEFQRVKSFHVYDFQSSGLPQIKIYLLNKPESFICDFPVKLPNEISFSEPENTTSFQELSEELEDLNKFVDDLNEEYNHLKKISYKNKPSVEKVYVNPASFSMVSCSLSENQFVVQKKWFRVFGNYLVLGMTLHNVGRKITDGLDVMINHEKIKDYAFTFFQPTWDITQYLFSAKRLGYTVDFGEEICAVGSFEIPEFYTESDLNIDCYVTPKNSKECFGKVAFEINVCDIALQTTVDLEQRFSGEDLVAVLLIKHAIHLKIQTDDLEDYMMELLLQNNLGFKLIKNMKDKLFYCTSTYLKEVFVALQHIAKNPSVWKMVVYTSQEPQIYFLVNALYDLLPENSSILCDENT